MLSVFRTFLTVLIATWASIASAQAPLKIGFVGTFSGPGAAHGTDQYDGFMLGIEMRNGRLGGVPVQVFKEDDQLKPEVGVLVTRKLMDREKVDLLTGYTFTNVLMAVIKEVTDRKIFLIGSNGGPSALAGAQCSEFFFTTAWQNDQIAETMGKYATDKGFKRMMLLAPNYQAGRDYVNGFKRYYKGEVLEELYTPLSLLDFSAEITQVQAQKPDAIFTFYPSGFGVNFVRQYAQSGLHRQVPHLAAFTVEGLTLVAQRETAVGTLSGNVWEPNFDNAENVKFVDAFQKKYKRTPSMTAAQSYDAAALLDSALRKTGGSLSDKKKVYEFLRAADFKSVRGRFSFNNNGFPIQDYFALDTVVSNGVVSQKPVAKVFDQQRDAYHTTCPLK